jgi:hypothetical protein
VELEQQDITSEEPLPDELIEILCAEMPEFVNDDSSVNWEDFLDEPSYVEKALMIANAAHLGQRGKSGRIGEPYFFHCLRVMMRGKDDEEKAVGVLHDALEDTDVTARELLQEGIPLHIVQAVVAISHKPGEPRVDYYERLKQNDLALRVKRYDLDDNTDPERMALLDKETKRRLTKKYKKAYSLLYGEDWKPA